MSKRVDQKKEAARIVREQLAKERRKQRTLWVTAGSIAVVVILLLVGWGVWESQKADSYTAPATVTNDGGKESGLSTAGDGPVTVEVYLDFMCPSCKQFESDTSPTIDQLIAEKKIKLVWHPLGFLDHFSQGTKYSTRSASAAGCAADAGKLKEYGNALFANAPQENTTGLTDDRLIEIGGNIGITGETFAQCVRDHTYENWVKHVNDEAAKRVVKGTPTVFVNGKLLEDHSPEGLKKAVAEA